MRAARAPEHRAGVRLRRARRRALHGDGVRRRHDGRAARSAPRPRAGEEIPLDVCAARRALASSAGSSTRTPRATTRASRSSLVHRDVSPGNVLIDRIRRREAHRLRHRARRGDRAPHRRRAAQGQARVHVARAGRRARARRAQRSLHARHRARRDGHRAPALLAAAASSTCSSASATPTSSAIDRAAGRVPDDVRVGPLPRAREAIRRCGIRTPPRSPRRSRSIVRRRRLQVGPRELAACVEKLGLVGGRGRRRRPTDRRDRPEDRPRVDRVRHAATRRVTREEPSRRRATERRATSRRNLPRAHAGRDRSSGRCRIPRLVELFATGRARLDRRPSRARAGSSSAPTNFTELARFVTSPALRWDDDFPKDAIERGPHRSAHACPRALSTSPSRARRASLVLRRREAQEGVYLRRGRARVRRIDREARAPRRAPHRARSGAAHGSRDGARDAPALRRTPRRRARRPRRASAHRALSRDSRPDAGALPRGLPDGRRAISRSFAARARTKRRFLSASTRSSSSRAAFARVTTHELEAILAPFSEEILEPVALPPVRLEAFRLTEPEVRVLRRVDGTFTIGRLMASGVADADDVLRAVFIGLSCQLVNSKGW